MSPWRHCAAILVTCLAVTIHSPAIYAGVASPAGAEGMEARIWELRSSGRYSDAAVVADSLLALRSSDPVALPFEIADTERLLETLRHVAMLPEEEQRALAHADSLRDFIESADDHAAAIAATEEQLAVRLRLLGEEHPDVAWSLFQLGGHAESMGDYDRSNAACKDAVRVALATLGEDHPTTARYVADLANTCNQMGQNAKAESLSLWSCEIHKRVQGEHHPATLVQLADYGNLKMNLGDFSEAETILREARGGLIEALGENHRDVWAPTNNLACLLQWLNRYEESETLYQQALDVGKTAFGEVSFEFATATHGYGALRSSRGDWVTAEKLYKRALGIYEEVVGPDHTRLAGIMGDLAIGLGNLGRYDESDAMCREVIDRWPGELSVAGSLYRQLSGNARDRGDPATAEAMARKALDIKVELYGPDNPWSAGAAMDLAYRMYDCGDLVGCEAVAREALGRLRAAYGEKHTQTAWTLRLLAGIHVIRGDFARAEAEAREVLEILRDIYDGDHIAVANTLGWFAWILRGTGRASDGIEYSQEALAMARRVLDDGDPRLAGYLAGLANGYAALDDFAAAELLRQEALEIERHAFGAQNIRVAEHLRVLGNYQRARGDLDVAEESYSECLEIEREIYGEGNPARLYSAGRLATIRYARDDYRGAEVLAAEAVDSYDIARQRFGTGMERASYSSSPGSTLALAQLAQGHGDAAWSSVERMSARALADLLAGAERRGLTPEEVAREDFLRGQIASLERRLETYESSAEVDSTAVTEEELATTREELALAEQAWSTFRYEMADRHPESEGRALELPKVQDALGAETALVGWLDVERPYDGMTESWVYVVRDRGSVTWARLEDTGADAKKSGTVARAIRDAIADPSSPLIGVTRESRALWQERFAPVADALEGVRVLVVVPSGPLLGVPVEALVLDDGRFAGDVYQISYSPSATIYARLGGGELVEAPPARSLFVGDPPFTEAHLAEMDSESDSPWALLAMAEVEDADASLLRGAVAGNDESLSGLARLSGTRAEVLLLSAASPGATVLLGPDASEQELVSLAREGALKEYWTLHIATHALVDDEHPEQSALVLSQVDLPDPLVAAMKGDRIYDGLVTAKEIMAEWELDADLVTLSACETGLGREMVGEGYVGFAHAFLQAGARSLVVSLWKVDDRATALLMQRFYENRSGRLAEPLPKAEALAEAKAWLRAYTDESGRRPYEHPYYWSAFILIGDPS